MKVRASFHVSPWTRPIAVPVAVISLIAIALLPNVPLTRMTTTERREASEADLAPFSVSEGMDALSATGAEESGEPREDLERPHG